MLEQCCIHSKRCRNNVARLCCAKNRRCNITLCNIISCIITFNPIAFLSFSLPSSLLKLPILLFRTAFIFHSNHANGRSERGFSLFLLYKLTFYRTKTNVQSCVHNTKVAIACEMDLRMFSVFEWQVVNEHRDLTKLQRQLERKTFSEQYKNSARTSSPVSANFFPFPAQLRRENGNSKKIKTQTRRCPPLQFQPELPHIQVSGWLVWHTGKKSFQDCAKFILVLPFV